MSDLPAYRGASGEDILVERWRWEVDYVDGTSLHQFGLDGKFHEFKEINQNRLAVFRMVSDIAPPFFIVWKQGRKLIHFYRNLFLHYGKEDEEFIRLYCFGFQEHHVKLINVIMPDDTVIQIDSVDRIAMDKVDGQVVWELRLGG